MPNAISGSKALSYGLWAFVAPWAITTPLTAHAQTTAPTSQDTVDQTDRGLSEIIVTAQRRAENLQDVPISVTAVTAASLTNSGLSATKDLPQMVPSVQMSRSGPSGLFFVRGVGTTNGAAGEEGANAFYVDGVYLGDLNGSINNFNNIARIEVLKGPQGTLFGRNATGGLIHIITREPGQETVFDGQIGYANYDTISSQLYLATPITDSISADIAYTGLHQNDGWGRNLTLNTKNKVTDYGGVRSKIIARVTDDFKLSFAGDYFKIDDNQFLAWRIADGTVGTGGFTSPGNHNTTANRPAKNRNKTWGFSMTGELDLGFANLTSITAARRGRNHSNFDVDGGPLDLVNIDAPVKTRQFQQEIRLGSKTTHPFAWQLGGFYFNSKVAALQTQSGDAFAPANLRQIGIRSNLETTSYALFGELSYAITPTTTLTGGLRYTQDKRDFDGNQTPILLSGINLATTSVVSTLKYSEFTYRAALRQDITDNINMYASINRGFKAGAYSLQSPTSPSVKPQFIMAYEVGLKSELFDRRLRLNVAAYHYDIDDYQIRSAAAANPGSQIFLNAATVKVDGFDTEFEAAPTDRLRLFGGFTVLNSRYDSFGAPGATFLAPIIYPNPATCPVDLRGSKEPGVLGAGPRTGGYTTCYGDVSGNRTPLAPKFAGSIGASYNLPVGDEGNLRLSALYSYNDGYVFDPDSKVRQHHFDLINASVEYRPQENFGAELWVKNLTNTKYSVQDLTTGTGSTQAQNPPRTYGINLKVNF